MRCRRKDSPSVVSIMTFRELRRYGEVMGHARHGEFEFHGLHVDAHRVFKHDDPLFVLYKDGREIGQLGEHDRLVIEDDGRAYPITQADFETLYERDPDWAGGAWR